MNKRVAQPSTTILPPSWIATSPLITAPRKDGLWVKHSLAAIFLIRLPQIASLLLDKKH